MLNNLPPGQYTIFSPTLGFWHPENGWSFSPSNLMLCDSTRMSGIGLISHEGGDARFVSTKQIAKQLRTLLQEMDSSSPRKQD